MGKSVKDGTAGAIPERLICFLRRIDLPQHLLHTRKPVRFCLAGNPDRLFLFTAAAKGQNGVFYGIDAY